MNDPCQTPPRGFLDVIDVDELAQALEICRRPRKSERRRLPATKSGVDVECENQEEVYVFEQFMRCALCDTSRPPSPRMGDATYNC